MYSDFAQHLATGQTVAALCLLALTGLAMRAFFLTNQSEGWKWSLA